MKHLHLTSTINFWILCILIGIVSFLLSYISLSKIIIRGFVPLTICFFLGLIFFNYLSSETITKRFPSEDTHLSSLFVGLFSAFLSAWIIFSFLEPLPLKHSSYVIISFLFLGLFSFFYLSLINLHYSANTSPSHEFHQNYFFNFFIIFGFVLSNFFSFIRYYPGLMMTDSIWQWQQLKTNIYSNWHPVVDTLIMKACISIWNTPASYALLQSCVSVIVLSMVFIYFFNRSNKGFPRFLILTIAVLTMAMPLFTVMNQFITKDSLFSTISLLQTYLVYRVIKQPELLHKKIWILSLAVSTFLFATLRSNTFIVLLAFEVVFFTFRHTKDYKNWHLLFLGVVLLKILITGPVYNSLGVEKADPSESFAIPTQIIAAVYDSKGQITHVQKEKILKILPDSQWKTLYNPLYVDSIKFTNGTQYNRKYIRNHLTELTLLTAQISIQNPKIALKAYYLQTLAFWKSNTHVVRIFDDRSTQLYSVPSSVNVTKDGKRYTAPGWSYANYWTAGSNFKNFYNRYLKLCYKPWVQLLITPATIFIFTLSLLAISVRKFGFSILLSQLFPFFTFSTLALAIPASQLRYFTPFYLNVILLLLLLLSTKNDADEF